MAKANKQKAQTTKTKQKQKNPKLNRRTVGAARKWFSFGAAWKS